MITKEDEDFLRIAMLLLKGGGLISKKTLNKHVDATQTPIETVLVPFKKELRHQFHTKQFNKLFPSSGSVNIEEWDIHMITSTLLTVFKNKLTKNEFEAISAIKSVRNEVYAHRSVSSPCPYDYNDIRNELETAMKTLSSQMERDEKERFAQLIRECTEWQIDSKSAEELCEGISHSEELLKDVLGKLKLCHDGLEKTIREEHDRTRKDLDRLYKILTDEKGSIEKILVVLGVEITLKGAKDSSELIDKARYILKKAFECAEKKAGTCEYTQVVKAVEELFDEVEGLGELKILPPEFKCINMYIKCETKIGLYRLLRYLESDAFGISLQKIVTAIEEEMEVKVSTFSLISRLIQKCLNEILKTITEAESTYMCKIELPVEVRSCDGIAQVDHWVESGQAQKCLNAISETISSRLGAKIAIKPSLNVKTIKVTPESTRISTFISHIPEVSFPNFHKDEEDNKDKANVTSDKIYTFSEIEDKDGTDELFKSLILIKSDGSQNPCDSGIGDSISNKTGKSTTSSIKSSDAYDEDDQRDTDDLPRKKIRLDIPDVSIGMAVNLRKRDDSCIIMMTTIGPLVFVDGTNARYFITVSDRSTILKTAFIPSSKKNAKISEETTDDNILLVEVVDDADSASKNEDKGLEGKQGEKWNHKNISVGTTVYKMGVSGITKGLICGTGQLEKRQDIMYVTSLPGSQGKPFAVRGDAGAAVFCEIDDNYICIGILLGFQTNLYSDEVLYVITNIDNIIKEMQYSIDKKIFLDHNAMSSQISNAI